MLFGVILYSIRTIGPSLEEAKKEHSTDRVSTLPVLSGSVLRREPFLPVTWACAARILVTIKQFAPLLWSSVRVPNEKEK